MVNNCKARVQNSNAPILPYFGETSFLIFFARLGYYWKQRNGIQESQVSKLCRYCQNPLCFQWLSQWCWPGVVGIFTASYYHFIIIMSQFITFILLSVDIVLLSYLYFGWKFWRAGWNVGRRQNEWRQQLQERFGVYLRELNFR